MVPRRTSGLENVIVIGASKFSEIYDRIAFAAVGRYNEFENLRKAGVRFADMTGFQYDRQDVSALGLANWYAQPLSTSSLDKAGRLAHRRLSPLGSDGAMGGNS